MRFLELALFNPRKLRDSLHKINMKFGLSDLPQSTLMRSLELVLPIQESNKILKFWSIWPPLVLSQQKSYKIHQKKNGCYLNWTSKCFMKMSAVKVWWLYNVSRVKFLCEVFHLRLAHGGFGIVATFHAASKVTVGQCTILSFSRRRNCYWSWQSWMSELAIQVCLAIMFAICVLCL